jgi:hypothetical protein
VSSPNWLASVRCAPELREFNDQVRSRILSSRRDL